MPMARCDKFSLPLHYAPTCFRTSWREKSTLLPARLQPSEKCANGQNHAIFLESLTFYSHNLRFMNIFIDCQLPMLHGARIEKLSSSELLTREFGMKLAPSTHSLQAVDAAGPLTLFKQSSTGWPILSAILPLMPSWKLSPVVNGRAENAATNMLPPSSHGCEHV
jgi:hypothetical protein